jgi:hypothetical protein
MNKHQLMKKKQDRQINKDMKIQIFWNVMLHRAASSFRRFEGS